MIETEVEIKTHVLTFDGVIHHRAREALRYLSAEIGVQRGETQRWRHTYRYQKRVGNFIVVVGRDAESALEELEVDTYVLVDSFLPSQILVGEL